MHFIPRKYTTEKVKAGGVEVAVRQTLGSYDKNTPGQVAAAVQSAQQWLRDAMLEVRVASAAKESPFFVERFKYCFQTAPTKQRIFEVSGVLEKINTGLSRSLGIKVWDMREEGRLGYVRFQVKQSLIAHLDEEGDIVYPEPEREPLGEIHLDRRLLSVANKAPFVLVHEAGHKFAKLEDVAYADANIREGNPYRVDMDWEDTKRNADSYAMFVFRLSRTQLNPRLQTQQAQKAAAPAVA